MLRKPRSLVEGQVFVGTSFEKHFASSPGAPGEWYKGIISEVKDKLRGTAEDSRKLLKGLFFDVRYADGDREDLEWDELFSGKPDICGINLPTAVKDNLDAFTEPEGADPDTAFKPCHSSLMTPSGCALDRLRLAQNADYANAVQNGAVDDSAHRLGGRTRGATDAENHSPNCTQDLQPQQKKRAPSRARGGEAPPPEEGRHGRDASSSSGSDDEEAQPTHAAKRQRTQPVFQGPSQHLGSQRPRRTFPQLAPNPMTGKAGQIKSVHAVDFMCHKNFEVEFGPHLNFISGENGSGKSAALQCLQVCLGVQARLTGRAKTGKELINDNSAVATAKVVLWNTGDEAYQPDEYGPTITFARKIRRSGGSEYFLGEHGCKGLGHPAKKVEIDAILEHFNIDAANPIICLTQDHARAFAGSQSDEHKYELYMKATGFEAIMQRQNASEAHIQQVKEHLNGWSDRLEAKKAEVEGYGKKLEEMKGVATLQKEVADLDRCIAWSEALDLRVEVQQLTAAIEEQLPKEVDELKQKVDDKAAEVAEAATEVAKRQEERVAARDASRSVKEELRKLASEQSAAAKLLRAASHQARQAAAAVADKRAELVAVKESHQELQEQHIQETQAEAASHAGKVRDGRQALEEAASRASRTTQALHEAEMYYQQLQQDHRAKQDELNGQNNHARSIDRDIRELRRTQGDPVLAFGGDPIKNLLNKIEAAMRQGRFSQRPIGPLGSLLSLADDKWAVAVEFAIGRCFNDFLVSSTRDHDVLKDLMRQCGLPKAKFPTVSIVTFGLPKHNLGSKPQPPGDLVTILRVLQLPEDGAVGNVVFNHLVDSQRAEKRILVETESDGLRMLRTTHKALFRNGAISDVHDVMAWRAYARGDSENAFRNPNPPNPRLRKDVQGHLRELEQKLAAIQQGIQPARADLDKLRTELDQAKQAVERARRAKGEARRFEATQKAELLNIQSQEQDATEGDISKHDETAALEQELSDLCKEADERARAEEQKREKADAATAAHNALRESEADKFKAAVAATEAFTASTERKHEVDTELRHLQDAMKEKDRLTTATKLQVNTINGALNGLLARAAEICSEEEAAAAKQRLEELWLRTKRRPSDTASLLKKEELEKRVNQLRKDIRKQESTAGDSYEALQARYEQGSKWFALSRKKLQDEVDKHSSLRRSLSKRAKKQALIRDNTGKQINIVFARNLKQRGWQGHIEIDHDTGKLTIRVKMEGAKAAHQDLKTLSGGERSFITICFLLALGHQLLPKFHCLDEFDVFMDSLSQGQSMMLLMEFAALQKGTQMILLTPQSLSAIEQARASALEKQPNKTWPSERFILIKRLESAKRDDMRSTQHA
ncbi:g11742 [Coccomyxa viridis]|uniref:G11742 protein n=1 Tax=Coccomyxa viridis TaxID=1274662 RepID=A0ABP1G8Z8_9CHLO